MDTPNMDQVADELVKDVKSDMQEKPVKNEATDQPIDNKKYEEKTTKLLGLGEVELVSKDELEGTLQKFDGVVFKIQNCMFRVCYIDKSKGRFTAEAVNLKK